MADERERVPMPAGTAREVFLVSLRLGLTAFGGPIAHIGYQREAFVVRRGWLDDAAFAELVALSQALPGPASSQLSIAVGRLRAGWAGALAAWLGFTLPSAMILTIIGLTVAQAGVPTDGLVAGLIAGLKVAAVAVVAGAVLTMGRRLTPDPPRIALAAGAAAVLLAFPAPFAQTAMIVIGGTLGYIVSRRAGTARAEATVLASPHAAVAHAERTVGARRTSLALLGAFIVLLLGTQVLAAATGSADAGFVAAIVRAGSLVFGGGHVVLPLLDAGVVQPGWVTEGAFLGGYGAAQAMPGPLFSFAAYLGAVSSAGPGGIPGAIVATVAIFLPGALLVLAALPVLERLRGRPHLPSVLAGINAVVVGILAAALITPVGTGGITTPAAAVLAVIGTLGLVSGRVAPLTVVAGCALAMGVIAVLPAPWA